MIHELTDNRQLIRIVQAVYRPSYYSSNDFSYGSFLTDDDLTGNQVKGGSGRDNCMGYVSVSRSHSLVSKWLSLVVPVSLCQFMSEKFN